MVLPAESATLLINPRTLQVGGPCAWIDISDVECSLLKAFVFSPDQRLESDHALRQIGKPADPAAKKALEVQIVRLRKKLIAAGAAVPTIKSIRGVGYQLCVPLQLHNSPAGKP